MEAKELMIGDKVMVKVLSQIPDTYVLHTWTANDYSRSLQVKPIPLTAEILEKNGLEKTLIDEEYCYSLVTMDYVIVIRTNRDGYWKYDSVREIGRGVVIQRKFDYVHQLQHALRLCGLDELADNFKV